MELCPLIEFGIVFYKHLFSLVFILFIIVRVTLVIIMKTFCNIIIFFILPSERKKMPAYRHCFLSFFFIKPC